MRKRVKYALNIMRNVLFHQEEDKILEAPPVFTNNKKDGLKIHLGAGNINLQGWVNIDAQASSHIHIVDSSLLFDEFTDGSISVFYLCHILEHFTFKEAEILLGRICN